MLVPGLEAALDRLAHAREHDWHRRCCSLGGLRRERPTNHEYIDFEADEFIHEGRESVDEALDIPVLDDDVLAIDIAIVTQARAQCL